MLITKKMLLALVLIGALVGGGIGALVTRSSQSTAAETNYGTTSNADRTQPITYDNRTSEQIAAENSARFRTLAEENAYRQGFDAGLSSCTDETVSPSRTSYRSSVSSTYRAPRRSSTQRRVYYDYSQPKGRSFWQKHRDKLTLAIGTGTGAGIGALIGGKKGAGIGALAGLGGSALYTYKLRKRNRDY